MIFARSGNKMQLWKFAAICSILFMQSPSADAAQSNPQAASSTSCLKVLGKLGAGTDSTTITVVDGSTLEDPSDIRSLRKKAKDGLPIVIKGGDFANRKFGDDDFSNLCFDGTKLNGTRWIKSRANGAAFIGADLTGAVFDRVNMREVLFRNSILTRMDASGANMAYGQLDGGWDPSMAGLRLENTQMTGFRFVCGASSVDGCSFDRKQISLRGANLTNANLAAFALWDANLVDVVLNNTVIALDQVPQYGNANVQGSVLVYAAGKQASLSPDAFLLAVTALGAPQKPDTECASPTTPLSQIFCQAGQSALRAYRDDVDRLYQSMTAKLRPDGTAITVVAPEKEQSRYLASLRKCALRDEGKAIACISDRMVKRRAALVALVTKSSPLEPDARALFVNVQTPSLQSVSQDARLANLTPLLIGSAPTYLLAYRDDNNLLNARGVSQSADGMRCIYGFPLSSKTKSRQKNISGSTFNAWSSGAEFAVQPYRKVKKVKKTRKGSRQAALKQATSVQTDTASLKPGCATTLSSGPLVRLPLSEEDFDLLWTGSQPVG
jgi:uncharacterized protein YjbI with pentapeptide repeats